MKHEFPFYTYCTDEDGIRRLVIVLRQLGRDRWRGHRWLSRGLGDVEHGRWSALATFKHIGMPLREGEGEVLTHGADWRDFSAEVIINGVVPAEGLLVVSHSRRRVYGVVIKATRDGKLRWRGSFGCTVESGAEELERSGVTYETEAPAGYQVGVPA